MNVNNDYDKMFDAAGKYYNVDPQLLKTVFHIESGGNVNTRDGASGEEGAMQLLPSTAAKLHVVDPRDMTQAIPAAAQLLRAGLDQSGGNPAAALAYYNSGNVRNPDPAYVAKAAQLYPQMQAQAPSLPAVPGSDAAFKAGDAILSGNATPASPSTPAPPAPALPATSGSQGAFNTGDAILSKVDLSQATPPVQTAVNPTTGQTDTMVPGLRNALAEAPGYVYGNVIPLKRDLATNEISPTVPGFIRNFGNGVLDLAEAYHTGVMTPNATMTLGGLMAGAPSVFGSPASSVANAARAGAAAGAVARQTAKEAAQPGILPQGFRTDPFAPSYMPPGNWKAVEPNEFVPGAQYRMNMQTGEPEMFTPSTAPGAPASTSGVFKLDATNTPNADPASAQTGRFAKMLQGVVADRIAHSIGSTAGHMLGGTPGAFAGYYAADVIRGVTARFGPKVGTAVGAALSKRLGLPGLPSFAPQTLPQPQQQQLAPYTPFDAQGHPLA